MPNSVPLTASSANIKTAGPVAALVIIGGTGDLSRRMLMPSLYGLYADGYFAHPLTIIGTGRSPMGDEAFRALIGESLSRFLPRDRIKLERVAGFLAQLTYCPLDATEADGLSALKARLETYQHKPLGLFLSVGPALFAPTIAGLKAAGLAGTNIRIALEKPLGEDLPSSCQINDALQSAFPEQRTFRVDHYLGKETVQNLLALRFGNILLEPLWNAQYIEHVSIAIHETVGLEGREDYYDGTGALRDMIQNHALQLLTLMTMEPPARFDAAAVRDEKVKVLRSLRPFDLDCARDCSVIGQYERGVVDGAVVPGYLEELKHPSNTETFVTLKAHIDNWRWKGVPFYLRTGKRLAARHTEIALQFKPVPHSIFAGRGAAMQPNRLRIRLQPEEDVRLSLMAKVPGLDREGVELSEVTLDLSLKDAFAGTRRRIAYERLLLDFIDGDPTLFVRRDEVEAQWAWIDRVRASWSAAGLTPTPYAAGSWGPNVPFMPTNGEVR